ncbi:MAG: hypothetical protein IIC26_05665, partial [Chloroflexi bacterium]|nr:hypothetical protein [Chloroflexota bacterium]
LWQFDTNATSPTWTTFEDPGELYLLASGLGTSATQDVVFRLTMPTSTESNNQHSATVTIVAVEPDP